MYSINSVNVALVVARRPPPLQEWGAFLSAAAGGQRPWTFPAPPPLGARGAPTFESAARQTRKLLDVGRLRKMAFKVNWAASYDFPYMGMFLPPTGEHEPYRRIVKGNLITLAGMREAARHWRFRPATQGGLPVAATLPTAVHFRLTEARGR